MARRGARNAGRAAACPCIGGGRSHRSEPDSASSRPRFRGGFSPTLGAAAAIQAPPERTRGRFRDDRRRRGGWKAGSRRTTVVHDRSALSSFALRLEGLANSRASPRDRERAPDHPHAGSPARLSFCLEIFRFAGRRGLRPSGRGYNAAATSSADLAEFSTAPSSRNMLTVSELRTRRGRPRRG